MRYRSYEDRLPRLFTAVISDVMDALEMRGQCLAPVVRPLVPTMRTWGEAVTMYLETVAAIPERPFHLELEVLDDLDAGQVIVAQCNAPTLSAFWGGLLSNAAIGRKGTGVVCDGGVRDFAEITALGFPTFCAGLIPYDSLGRMDGRERGIPVVCGGVRIIPGDLVFGDADGVIVVPQDMVDEVIRRAWEKVRGENTVREELRSGAGAVATFEKYGIL